MMGKNWLNLMNLLKKILISTQIVYRSLNEQKKVFNRLGKENFYKFHDLKEKKHPNNLVYEFKTEGSTKDFSNYQNPVDLFINFRDGNVSPREVLKNQKEFKSDLDEIKKENSKSKSKDQISVIQNVQSCFDLREKIINAFRDYSVLVSQAKYKAKEGKRLKILSPKQMFQKLSITLAQVKAGNTSENLLN